MSKNNHGPIGVAAQAAAEKVFADIKNTVVTAAEGEAQAAVQAAFDESYNFALARLISGTRKEVYSVAYADALANASNLLPTPPPAPPQVPAPTEEILPAEAKVVALTDPAEEAVANG